jgi:excisionase family DNA binding protein
MSEAMLETKDVAQSLGLSVRRVRRLLSSEKLRHVRIRRQFFVPEEAVQEFLSQNMVETCQADKKGNP